MVVPKLGDLIMNRYHEVFIMLNARLWPAEPPRYERQGIGYLMFGRKNELISGFSSDFYADFMLVAECMIDDG